MNPSEIISKVKARLLSKGSKPDLSPQAEAVIHELAEAVSVKIREMMAERKASPRMKPPTLEEVILHGAKIGLPKEECEAFVNFYTSKGWLVGKQPMKSWTAALSNWKKGWQEKNPAPSIQDAPNKWNWRESL